MLMMMVRNEDEDDDDDDDDDNDDGEEARSKAMHESAFRSDPSRRVPKRGPHPRQGRMLFQSMKKRHTTNHPPDISRLHIRQVIPKPHPYPPYPMPRATYNLLSTSREHSPLRLGSELLWRMAGAVNITAGSHHGQGDMGCLGWEKSVNIVFDVCMFSGNSFCWDDVDFLWPFKYLIT